MRVGKRFFLASAVPQAAYGGKVSGLAPSRIQDLRRAAGAVLSHAKKGRCLTTRFALELGTADPGVTLRVDLVKSWLDFVAHFPGDFARIRSTWENVYDHLVKKRPRNRWKKIGGPVAAVISLLLDAG